MKYKMQNSFLQIGIDTQGAELTQIRDAATGYEYLWQGNPEFWDGRAPILFPIIGNLNNGRYLFDGLEYSMKRHGFAREMNFEVEEVSKYRAAFYIRHNPHTTEQYPFEFSLRVAYTLSERTLITEYLVRNTGDRTMWFSIGGHPGFNCSMKPNGKKDVKLHFNRKETVNCLVNKSGYLTGKEESFLRDEHVLGLSVLDFDGKTKVYIMKGLQSDVVVLEDGQNGRRVEVNFIGFPYLGIWSPANAAPFVCIEPWYGVTSFAGTEDVLDKKRGIQKLGKADAFTCSFEILCC